jgi:hypothetical protein
MLCVEVQPLCFLLQLCTRQMGATPQGTSSTGELCQASTATALQCMGWKQPAGWQGGQGGRPVVNEPGCPAPGVVSLQEEGERERALGGAGTGGLVGSSTAGSYVWVPDVCTRAYVAASSCGVTSQFDARQFTSLADGGSMHLHRQDTMWPVCIIIIMLPNQAIASTPSAPRPSGAEGRGSTAPLCLQLLRTSQACTRYSGVDAMA